MKNSKTETQQEGEGERRGAKLKVEFKKGRVTNGRREECRGKVDL